MRIEPLHLLGQRLLPTITVQSGFLRNGREYAVEILDLGVCCEKVFVSNKNEAGWINKERKE